MHHKEANSFMFRHNKSIGWLAAMIVVSWGAMPVRAGLIEYADYTSWSATVGSLTSVTIPDPSTLPCGTTMAGDGGYYCDYGFGNASVTYSGVTFAGQLSISNVDLDNVGVGFSGNLAPVVTSQAGSLLNILNMLPTDILITLPASVTAFSLNYGTISGLDVDFQLSNGNGLVQGSTGSSSYAVPGFFGVIDTTPFKSVQLTSADYELNVNDVVYGSAAATPEPGACGLMILGLSGIVYLARWRMRKQQNI
jgi:hypothetical protein